MKTMRKLIEFPAPDASDVAEACDPDLLLASTTSRARLYNWRSGRAIREWDVYCPFHFRLSPKVRKFIGQDSEGVVRLHPLDGGEAQRLGDDTWHATDYGGLSDDGSLIVTSSLHTATIRWWSYPNTTLLAECRQQQRIAVSKDARRVVSTDGGRHLCPMECIELLPNGRLSIRKGPAMQIRGVTLLNDANYFAVADAAGVTRVFEFGTFREVAVHTSDGGEFFSLCYLPKTNRLLIHYEDRTVSWDLKTDGTVEDVPAVRHPSGLEVINGGNRLAVCSRQWVRVFEV